MRRSCQVRISRYGNETVQYCRPIRFVGGLESWHADHKPREQLPRAFPDQRRVGFRSTKVFQRVLHELLDLFKPVANLDAEPVWCAHEVEEAGRVHLSRSEASEFRKLLSVWLWPRDDQAPTAFNAIRWRVYQGTNKFPDQSLRLFITPALDLATSGLQARYPKTAQALQDGLRK